MPTELNAALNQTLRKHPVLFEDSKEVVKTDIAVVKVTDESSPK